jgi:glutamyl-queuosine tRNA(Asp) synthetase
MEQIHRYAPSPSGPMHLGNARTAILAWRAARAAGGRILLRIDDLDRDRCRPEHEAGVREDLAWLGLHFDEDERAGVVRQSERGGAYAEALARLRAAGLVYPCYCSRREVRAAVEAPHDEGGRPAEPRYPGTCRALTPAGRARLEAEGRRPALRLRVPAGTMSYRDGRLGPVAEDVGEVVGDFVLRRSDGLHAYQLATVVDDGEQGVTDVVRGEDLASNTARQILLQRRLGLPTPRYLHTPLVLGADGQKLSKQTGAVPIDMAAPLEALRSAGAVLGIEASGTTVARWLADAISQWRAQWPVSHA